MSGPADARDHRIVVKGDDVKAWWNIVNWADAQDRFARARTQTAGLIVPL